MTTPITDRDSLLAAVQRGDRPKYLFFWGHQAPSRMRVGKECLSQWWPTSFVVADCHYASAEQFMMAEKARLFGDSETCQRILEAQSPAAAKHLGRTVRSFTEQVWVDARVEIVVRGNLAKFQQNPALSTFLRTTKERILVEASPVDRIWGIGLADDDPRARHLEQWRGLNLLGFALMQVRQLLRAGDSDRRQQETEYL